jgi:N,N'-diacetyllegionaminate synthase
MIVGSIDTKRKPMVIAEIGNNHEGSLDQAVRLVRSVATTGAQVVKFQTFKTEYYVSPENSKRFEQLKHFELSENDFREIARIAAEEGLVFLSTPFDLLSAKFLNDLVPAFKIGSGENTFYPLLSAVASFGKPIILSTGCADVEIITTALNTIDKSRSGLNLEADTAILHCITSYPTNKEDCNLAAITQLKQNFPGLTVGYSDHTLDMDACLIAIALGAEIIEKHFTLDKNWSAFHDHKLSATADELKEFMQKARDVRLLLGAGHKAPRPCEIEIENKVRRAICAAIDLPQGLTIESNHLCWTRPLGNGLEPGRENLLVGKRTLVAIKKGERILADFVT